MNDKKWSFFSNIKSALEKWLTISNGDILMLSPLIWTSPNSVIDEKDDNKWCLVSINTILKKPQKKSIYVKRKMDVKESNYWPVW